jgi:hypothetical protein
MRRDFAPELIAAASASLIQRGGVQVIGLSGIKAETGERWDKLKPSVRAHMETLLRQKLGPTDFFTRIDDTSFLVSMPSANAEEAQIFCLRIVHDLHEILLGHCEIGKLEIARATKVENGVLYTAPVREDLLGAGGKGGPGCAGR